MHQWAANVARCWPRVMGRRRGYRVLDRLVRGFLGSGRKWFRHGAIELQYDPASYHERLMAYELQGEEGFALLRQLLRPGDTFVDAGANVGLYSAAGADVVGPTGGVFSIEANPHLAERLRAAALRNAGRVGRWEVIQHALSSEDNHEIEFHLSHQPMWSSALPLDQHEQPSEVIRVATARFDTLAERFGKVRLLKIDIEGSECLAFAGAAHWLASPHAPDFILSECNDPVLRRFGASASELIATLRGHGYDPHLMEWRSAMEARYVPFEGIAGQEINYDLLFVRRPLP